VQEGHPFSRLWTQETLAGSHGGFRNNEIVLDMREHARRLPDAIEGFFYMKGTAEHDRLLLRQAHTAFIMQFRFPTQHAPPLMELDLSGGGDHPFTFVPVEHQWGAGEGR
jgi:hypothetical protein